MNAVNLICIYCRRVVDAVVVDFDRVPSVAMCEQCASIPPERPATSTPRRWIDTPEADALYRDADLDALAFIGDELPAVLPTAPEEAVQ